MSLFLTYYESPFPFYLAWTPWQFCNVTTLMHLELPFPCSYIYMTKIDAAEHRCKKNNLLLTYFILTPDCWWQVSLICLTGGRLILPSFFLNFIFPFRHYHGQSETLTFSWDHRNNQKVFLPFSWPDLPSICRAWVVSLLSCYQELHAHWAGPRFCLCTLILL